MECMTTLVDHLRRQPAVLLAAAAIGFISAVKLAVNILWWVYVTFLRPGKNLKKRYGSWAVVTGATDGIGKSFAFRLAAAGLNLVLVGRNPNKLSDVAGEIKSKFAKTQIKTVVIDFAGELVSGVRNLENEIRGIDVGVLVNNAGISYPYARYFHEVEEELMKNLIKVNVEGTTRITQAVISGMVERRRGAIVNMGSGGANIIPSDPLYSVYAGAKAYIAQFSRSLYVEYKDKGIDVQCQVPLYVATKLSSIRKANLLAASPDTYARAAIRWIGYEPTCTPYWPHSLIWCLFSMLPPAVIDKYWFRFCLGIRKKGQLKDAKKKAQQKSQ